MGRRLKESEIKELVRTTLTAPENLIKMLVKYGRKAPYRIDHGQLHFDFDNRENSSWNDDIINMFPLGEPVTMTSWKGTIFVHCLSEKPVDCCCMGTREIMEMILRNHGYINE